MDVRGRGEAALMGPSIAPRSTKGKDFTKKRDGFSHVGSRSVRNVGVGAYLLANVKFAGAHFGKNSVVWGMKIADFGRAERCEGGENGVIMRKSSERRHEVA